MRSAIWSIMMRFMTIWINSIRRFIISWIVSIVTVIITVWCCSYWTYSCLHNVSLRSILNSSTTLRMIIWLLLLLLQLSFLLLEIQLILLLIKQLKLLLKLSRIPTLLLRSLLNRIRWRWLIHWIIIFSARCSVANILRMWHLIWRGSRRVILWVASTYVAIIMRHLLLLLLMLLLC